MTFKLAAAALNEVLPPPVMSLERRGAYTTSGRMRGFALAGNYAYLRVDGDKSASMEILDLTAPATPIRVGLIQTAVFPVSGEIRSLAHKDGFVYLLQG